MHKGSRLAAFFYAGLCGLGRSNIARSIKKGLTLRLVLCAYTVHECYPK